MNEQDRAFAHEHDGVWLAASVERGHHHAISRRRFLARLAALAAATASTACGGTPATPAAPTALPAVAPSSPPPTALVTPANIVTAASPAASPAAATAPGTASADVKRGGVLKFALANEPLTLNAMETGGDQGLGWCLDTVYDRLVSYDYVANAVRPRLLAEWKQSDFLTWVLKLREGVQFHQGYGELTAEDPVYMINALIKDKHSSIFAWNSVKDAEVVDRYTFKVNLTAPYAPFVVTALASAAGAVISSKAHQELGQDKFNRNPIGTGPFEFESWVAGSAIKFKKFGSYWDKELPYLDGLEFRIIGDNYVRENALRVGEVDLVQTPDYKDVEDLKKQSGIVVYATPGQTFDFMAFNPNDPLLGDKRVRQAVSAAINRNAIVQEVYYGQAKATNIPWPPGFIGYTDKPYFAYGGDIARAKQLLTEAGHPDGISFPVIVSDKAQLRRELEVIQGQLEPAGISLEIQGLDLGTFNARFFNADQNKKDFRAAFRDINIVSPDPDSGAFWFHYPNTTGWVGLDDPEISKLLRDGRAEADPVKRAPLYSQLLDLLMDRSTYIYLVHASYVSAARDRVQNWRQDPTQQGDWRTVWLKT